MDETFHGEPTANLQSADLRLDYLTQAGPRLVRLILAGRQENLLAEVPDLSWDTPHGLFRPYGGHRLWAAPEHPATTYQPDSHSLQIEAVENGVRLIQPQLDQNGLQKTLEVRLAPDRPEVALDHILENRGAEPVEAAPWAITQVRNGGIAVLPLPSEPSDAHGLLPNRNLVLWPYTRLQDARLAIGDQEITIAASNDEHPLKVGGMNRDGWIAYLWQDVLFLKIFALPSLGPYPDLSCNAEVYTNHRFLELETLGPLERLEPGQTLQHSERWIILSGIEPAGSPAETARRVRSIAEEQIHD